MKMPAPISSDKQHFATDLEWEVDRSEGLLWRANHETVIPLVA